MGLIAGRVPNAMVGMPPMQALVPAPGWALVTLLQMAPMQKVDLGIATVKKIETKIGNAKMIGEIEGREGKTSEIGTEIEIVQRGGRNPHQRQRNPINSGSIVKKPKRHGINWAIKLGDIESYIF